VQEEHIRGYQVSLEFFTLVPEPLAEAERAALRSLVDGSATDAYQTTLAALAGM
jgi:hypothetical protein